MVNSLGIAIFVTEGTLLLLGIITVSWRVYTRTHIVSSYSYDDLLMIVALLINIMDTGFTFHSVAIGSGKTFLQFIPVSTVALRSIFFGELFYIPTVMFAKLSIGFFLLRLRRERWQRYTIISALTVTALFSILYFSLVLFQCFPVHLYWHIAEQVGKCMPKASSLLRLIARLFLPFIPLASFEIGKLNVQTPAVHGQHELPADLLLRHSSIIVATTDLLFAMLPVSMAWNLQMNRAMKISVAGLLATGALAGVSTLIRIPYIKTLGDDNPSTFLSDTAIVLVLLTCVESDLVIILGNLAALRPLIIKFLGNKDEIKQFAASRRRLPRRKVYNPDKWQISEFGLSMQRSFAGETLRDLGEGPDRVENLKMHVMHKV